MLDKWFKLWKRVWKNSRKTFRIK